MNTYMDDVGWEGRVSGLVKALCLSTTLASFQKKGTFGIRRPFWDKKAIEAEKVQENPPSICPLLTPSM